MWGERSCFYLCASNSEIFRDDFGGFGVSEIEMNKMDRYFVRTVEHIHRVQKNMVLIVTKCRDDLELTDEDCRSLIWQVMLHDQSKFSEKQFYPYIELTEYYRQKKILGNSKYQYEPIVKIAVDAAVEDHYQKENHHPEMCGSKTLTKWNRQNAIECVCDLQAMADEFDEGSCRKYWEEKWKPSAIKKNCFYDDHNWAQVVSWMDETIRCLEKAKGF